MTVSTVDSVVPEKVFTNIFDVLDAIGIKACNLCVPLMVTD